MPIYPTKTVDYNFDNPACYSGSGSTVYDLQGNLNLNFVGTPTFVSSSDFGNYFSFTTATVVANHLASAFSALFNGSFNFSFSYCIRLHNFSSSDNYFVGGLNSSTLASIDAAAIARINSGNWYTSVGYNENLTTSPANDDKWYVVTVTADFTNNQLKTYVNGTLVKTDGFGVAFSFTNAQIIMGYLNSNPYRADKLIDNDIKAYSVWKNVVLTAPQVQDVANEFAQYTSNYFSIDFGNSSCFTNGGTAINDLSGNARNFTLSSTTYTYDPTVGSLYFPISTNATGSSSAFIIGQQATTWLSWVKLQTVGNISVCQIGGGSRFYETLVPAASLNNIDNNGAAQQAGPITFDDNWHLLAVTKPTNGTTGQQKTYIDGVLIPNTGSYNPSQIVNFNTSGPSIIHPLDGTDMTMATLSLYTAELSGSNITAIYDAQVSRFNPPPPVYNGLVGGRQFGQGFNG